MSSKTPMKLNELMEKVIINNHSRQTNWYVITGGPSSGKTTTVNILRERGYITTMEHARYFLDTQRLKGKTIEEVRKNQRVFQLGVLDMQIEQEKEIAPHVQVFLDWAIPDALAYYRFLNLSEDENLTEALRTVSYKKVFIMDYLPLKNENARNENAEAQKKIHALITEVYESLPFPVVHVPVLPAEDRVDFILKNL